MKTVSIYTDGGCTPNPGRGAWAAFFVLDDKTRMISGTEEQTTNNRMELTAALRALLHLKYPCKVDLFTDSTYLQGGILKCIQGRLPSTNIDLWEELKNQCRIHLVNPIWVRGHQGNHGNEHCDQEVKRLLGARR